MSLRKTALVGLFAAVFALAGCDEKESAVKSTTDSATATTKVLKVGSTGQSYPNGFKQDGKLVGFDVETTEAIAKELGYTIEWTTAEFSGLMGQLDSGRLDTVANAVAKPKKSGEANEEQFKTHRIKKGETVRAIAAQYGVSVNKLCRTNGISARAKLSTGRTLRIPS